MKLITLNIWGGHVYDPLLSFIRDNQDTDIFCFQEVYHNAQQKISIEDRPVSLQIFAELQALLPQHTGFFRPVVDGVFGISTFVKNSVDVRKEGEISIHINPNYVGKGPTHSRNLQWLECRIRNQIFTILNVHGLWNGMGKTDTPERIAQSRRIRQFMDTIHHPKILCGDFNLKPDTESLRILEKDMTNLVKTHQVSSTRTSLYPKPERFADYILLSPEISLNKFEVLKAEVSDHAPLFIDIQ